ncbi:13473_t:CDS:10 [Entrophospora sp. SA101]|nr:13473_t:CDS:10 [Entrophospora sp. SA101]
MKGPKKNDQSDRLKSTFKYRMSASFFHKNGFYYSPPFSLNYETLWQLYLQYLLENCYHATFFIDTDFERLGKNRCVVSGISKDKKGIVNFIKKSTLPSKGEITIGVKLQYFMSPEEKKYSSKSISISLQKPSNDLLGVWIDELNRPETSDVQFNVNGKEIYARSSILVKQSQYFRNMFEGSLVEDDHSSGDNTKTDDNSDTMTSAGNLFTETTENIANKINCNNNTTETIVNKINNDNNQDEDIVMEQNDEDVKVDMNDINDKTLLAVLKYFYTGSIEFTTTTDSSIIGERPIDIFIAADRYLLDDLREKSRQRILQDLKIENVSELLFDVLWRWPTLRIDAVKYFAENFYKVRKTDGYHRTRTDPKYSHVDNNLWQEIIDQLLPKDARVLFGGEEKMRRCEMNSHGGNSIYVKMELTGKTCLRKHKKYRQHFLVKYIWDGNFSSPIEQKLSDGCKVAEINCGPAPWLLEMSSIYPSTEFHGIDLFGLFPTEIKPTNVKFVKVDQLINRLPFEDNYFDFIRMSFVENILKQNEWSIILEESLRILKPGGYLEYLEYETKIYDAGPKVTTFVDKFAKYLESVDRYQRLPFELFSTFPQLQNINIESRKSKTCYKHDDKVAELQFELFELYYESIVDIFSEYMGITKQEYADLWEEYRIESKSYTKAYTKISLEGKKFQLC